MTPCDRAPAHDYTLYPAVGLRAREPRLLGDGKLLGICRRCGSVRYYPAAFEAVFGTKTWESNADEPKLVTLR